MSFERGCDSLAELRLSLRAISPFPPVFALLFTLASAASASAACPSLAAAANTAAGANPYGVTIADFNRDGRLDLAVANSSDNNVSILLQAANGTFSGSTYSTGGGSTPVAITSADFNGDGKPDVAVANLSTNTVGILLGDGNGGLGTVNSFTVGNYPQSPRGVIAVDLNRDGKLDLAVPTSETGNVVVLLGAGDGTFGSPLPSSVGGVPWSVAAGDFNRDGIPDLAVTTGSIVILRGVGDGTFQTPLSFSPASVSPYDVAVADLNGDGIADIAAATSGHVDVLLGNGDGTFQNAVTYSAGSTGGAQYNIEIADFDGDGNADVVDTNPATGAISILRGNGSGALTSAGSFAVVASPDIQFVAAGDIDGDGRPDVAVANYATGNVSVLLNNGNCFANCGSFGTGTSYGAHTNPRSVATGDFNRDGRLDLAVANKDSADVSILLANGSGTFGAASNISAGTGPAAVAAADFTRDGMLDLAIANSGSGTVSLRAGNGSGGFGTATDYTAGTTPSALAAGDFNADGNLDLAIANNGSDDVTVLVSGGTTFTSTATFSAGTAPAAIVAGDFDRDGKLDLAVANSGSNNVSILIGSGSATFAAPSNVTVGTAPKAIAAGDFNGDGKLDLAVVNSGSNSVTILIGAGDGSFSAGSTPSVGNNPASVVAGDFNRDGKLDLAVGNGSSNSVSILVGNGNGTFQTAVEHAAAGNGAAGLAAADLNRDGTLDIAVANSGSDAVAVLLSNCPVADLTLSKSHTGNFTQGQSGATYSITVSNDGTGATSGTVTVTDTLPSGLTATGISGTNWNCDLGTLTCSRNDALAAAGSYADAITLTVTVAANAPASVTNTAVVSGGGEINTANDSASDPTTIVQVADLTVVKSHSGNFIQGQTGVTYTLSVSNAGTGATAGTVTVTDNPPTGLTITGMSGTNWNCTAPTCTRSSVLAAGATYPETITVTANVANNAPGTLTNSATVSGGGQVNAVNDTSNDPATILQAPDLTITGTSSGGFAQGRMFRTYAITVTNGGPGATVGTVTVVDTLPSGLTVAALGGTGWTCRPATTTCTRTDALAAGGSYPAITLTVNVATNAPASVTNSATVSGGSEFNTSNDGWTTQTPVAAMGVNCGTFATGSSNTTAAGPVGVAVGDFNRDGIADLVTANQNFQNVSVFLGNGDGTFAAKSDHPVGSTVLAVAVADFNGDGKADIAVSTTGGVVIFPGNGDANGTFGSPSSAFAAGGTPAFMATGDFNADGRIDLAVANSGSGDVSILIGNGSGGFSTGGPYPTGFNPSSIAVGDFDGDGDSDLAVTNPPSNTVSILKGNGDGTFAAKADYPTGGGTSPNFVIARDFDGDGKLDLAITEGPTNVVVIARGNGDGTFGTATAFAAGATPVGVVCDDFNADGKLDLAIDDIDSSVSVLLGNGNGTFGAPASYGTGLSATAIALGEFNGDGRPDIASANFNLNTVSVLPAACPDLAITKTHGGNFIQGQTGAVYSIVVQNVAIAPTVGTVTVVDTLPAGLTATSIAGTNWSCVPATLTCSRSDALAAGASYPAITVTVNVAGNAAASVTNSATVSASEANAANNTASDLTTVVPPADLSITSAHTGNFKRGQMFRTYTLTVSNSGPSTSSGSVSVVDTLPAGLTAVAIGGSGWTCLPSTLTCSRNDTLASGSSFPAITLTVNVAANAASTVTNVATVAGGQDLNSGNNSSSDATTVNADQLTCGRFSLPSVWGAGGAPAAMKVGDFNGDGYSDLAIANKDSNNIAIIAGNADAWFPTPATVTASAPTLLALGDFNGDGRTDVAAVNSGNNTLKIYGGAGDGSIAEVFSVGLTGATGLAVADFNGDGRLDIAASYIDTFAFTSGLQIALGNGDGTFPAFAFVPAAAGTNPSSIAAGDFDGDGKMDIALASSGATARVLLGNGNGSFTAAAPTATGTAPVALAAADFDADGKLDLAVANSGSNTVSILKGNGDGTFTARPSPAAGTGPSDIVAADVNGDGKTDLAVANSGSNDVSILLGNGDGTFAAAGNYAAGTAPAAIAIGFVESISAAELIVANHGSSNISVLYGGCIDVTTTLGYNGTFTQGQPNKLFNVNVMNAGVAAPPGAVSVTVNLPPQLTAVSLAGYNGAWDCNLGTLTCSTIYPFGTGYPGIAVGVDVAADAPSPLTISATVSAISEDITSNNTATMQVTVLPPPDLTVTCTHSGNFVRGQLFRKYTITVTNVGTGVSGGTVGVTDTLGAGLNVVSLSGSGWTCYPGLACYAAAEVQPGNSYPPLTLTVSVPASGPSSVTNSVTVSGGLDVNTANNSVTDPTTIVSPAASCGGFAPAVNYTTGSGASGVRIADYNNDGKADLAVVNETASTLSRLPGNGDGTFGAAVDWGLGTAPGNGGPSSIVAADFDLDGNFDFAIALKSLDGVTFLFGNSDGTSWQTGGTRGVGASPRAVAAGDFNGDGYADFVTANANAGTLSVMLNSVYRFPGDAASVTVGASPGSVAAGDFDGDGKLDLAVAGLSGSNSILHGNGDGTFGAPASFTAGTAPHAIVTADFNGDGKLDLAVANKDSNDVSVLLGNGNGTFAAAVAYAAGTSPFDLAVADFNGDGKLDLAVANNGSNNVSLLLGNGNGTFGAALNFAAGTSPSSIAAGDLNGDGVPDLAVTNAGSGNVSVLLNGCPDLTVSKSHSGTVTQGQTGLNYSITVSNAGAAMITPVSVTDTLPSGLTATAISGSGWSCTLGTLTCTRSDMLLKGASYPAITVTVNVASNAPATVTNTATVSGAGDTNGANNSGSDSATVNASGLIVPTHMVATATSATQISVTWDAVTVAASYQVFRSSNNSAFTLVGTPSNASFNNTGLTPGTTYVFQVKAVDSSNNASGPSNTDIATTIVFTDDPLVAGSTVIKAAHLTELRTAVNAVRAAAGLTAASFTDNSPAGLFIKAVHVTELRNALNAARSALGLPAISYTDPDLAAGYSVKAAHLQELRTGVK